MKKLIVFLLAAFGLLTACSHKSTNKDLQNSQFNKNKSHHGMLCIAPNIYVDPKMPVEQHKQFLQTVKQSKTEISHFFGEMQSTPRIYACTTKACFRKFGGVASKAKTIGDDKVMLSLNALNNVTLTHELAHVELHKRLGNSKIWNRVPMWFDEGLAVLVCKDANYYKSPKTRPLTHLTTQDQWVSAVHERVPAYSIARQAVHKWYKIAGQRGLQSLINQMQKGESFSSALMISSEQQIGSL